MPAPDLHALTADHNRRMSAIDPLIPDADVPAPDDGDSLVTVPDAAAIAHLNRVDPDSMHACWGALEQHALASPRVAGADPAASMRALLGGWQQHLAAYGDQDPESESSASVVWPSRDALMTRPFLDSGLVPRAVIAARPAGRAGAVDVRSSVEIRPITPDDIEDAVALALSVVRWDAQFGGVTERASTRDRIVEDFTSIAAESDRPAWLGWVDGEAVGLATIDLPAEPWIAPSVRAERVAYLGYLSVRAGQRGAGVGSALVAHVHGIVDAAGVDVTLLHHSALNPLSGPFWNRWGYRPLWTSWDVRPYRRLSLS